MSQRSDPQFTAWHQHVETTSLDEHARVQGNWDLEYVQLSEGVFSGLVDNIHLPQLTLVREALNVATRQRGRLNADTYGFALRDADSDDFFANGRRMSACDIMVGKGDAIDITTPHHCVFSAMAVERSLLEPLWEGMYHKPVATWMDQHLVLETSPVKAAMLRDKHLSVMKRASALIDRQAGLHTLLQLRDDILAEWLEAIPAQVDISDLPTLKRRKQVVDLACERMMAQVDEPESLLSVCTHLGVSVRKLNYCFQDVLGISPNKYHKMLRLNGAHRDLMRPSANGSVQDIAAKWGFWHLSQFARDYKRQFKVLPSETLRQSAKSKLGAD